MSWPTSEELLKPLGAWYDRFHRDLPWRADDLARPHPDPYAVLVSELMLQQTQVATVIPYFNRWMERFPTPQALANASDDAVHKAWEGLGYYRRARFLQATAGSIAADGWPGNLADLTGLPGLGPYTAAAVGAIAFQWPTAALDGNAFRVLARLLLIEGDPKARAAELRTWLTPALQAQGPSRLTQAIMELGATVCAPVPNCPACPLSAHCGARQAGRTGDIPLLMKRAKPKEVAFWLVAFQAENQVLLHPPATRGLLAGLWRWPSFPLEEFQPHAATGPGRFTTWAAWTQVYTHRRERVNPLHITVDGHFEPLAGLRWVPLPECPNLPMGKRDQCLRSLLGSPGLVAGAAPDPEALLKACAAPGR